MLKDVKNVTNFFVYGLDENESDEMELYSEGFTTYLRDHLSHGIIQRSAVPKEISEKDYIKHCGDIFSFLRFNSTHPCLDWVHLSINGMSHPTQWDPERNFFLLIPQDKVSYWYSEYMSHKEKKKKR